MTDTAGSVDPDVNHDPNVYRDRAHLIALLTTHYPAIVGRDPAAPDWPVVYIETPAGQLSWHIAPDDMDLFSHLRGTDRNPWDGHSTDEKHRRIRMLIDW